METAANATATVMEVFYPRSATIFAAICAVLFTIVGVVGNLVTVVALLRCKKLRQHATTAFVLSLCVSDLLFCSINLPLTASRYVNQAWLLGPGLCKLFPVLFYGNVAVSLLSMVAITVNRYILISCHWLYDRLYTPRYIFLMLLFAWGFSFAMMLPPLLEAWGRLGLDPPTFSCTILKKDGASPKKLFFVVGFLLPCVVIVLSYSCIYWKVRRSRANLQAHSPLGGKGAVSAIPVQPAPSLPRREDIRLTRLMLTIFCAFILCFLPLMLVNVADDAIRFPTAHVLASILAWASSVVNPFIYAVSNRQYRAAYRQVLPCGGGGGTAGGAATNSGRRRGTGGASSHSESGRTFMTATEVVQYNAGAEKLRRGNAEMAGQPEKLVAA